MADDDTTQNDDDISTDEDQTLVTKEGLTALKNELHELKTVRRQDVAKRLKEAISYGDLSENSEYEEAKNEQAFVEGRILELERKIKNARIIATKKDKGTKDIDIGSTLTVRNKTDGEDPETFSIVGSTEADPIAHKISNESPLGKAFIGSKKGDILKINTPSGIQTYEVLKVE